MAYRKNVTDKQQGDIERAADCSAIRFAWFDGKVPQKGQMKAISAYDFSTGVANVAVPAVGAYNDNPNVFVNPGKA